VVLQQHRAGRAAPPGPARPALGRGGREGLDGERRGLAASPPARHAPGARGRGALLLRVARPPGRRSLLGLPADREPLRPGQDPGAQPLRLARRGIRSERRGAQLPGNATVGRPARDRALDPRHADAEEDARGCHRFRQGRGARLLRAAAALLRPLAEGRPERHRPRGARADLRDGRQRLARRDRMAAGPRANGLLPARLRPARDRSPPASPRSSDGYVYDEADPVVDPHEGRLGPLRPEPAPGAARRARHKSEAPRDLGSPARSRSSCGRARARATPTSWRGSSTIHRTARPTT
jgi:hypothetical protein